MNLTEYKEKSQRTFAYRKEPLSENQTDLLHCAIGASTETGELLDAFKKHIYYGKPLDIINIGEEIADTMWYLSNLARMLNLDIEKLLENNIAKLTVRFPDKFTEEKALNRNLDSERKVLESNQLYKVVGYSNHGLENVSDILIADELTEEDANLIVETKNELVNDSSRFIYKKIKQEEELYKFNPNN